jgi:hypothetical protein
MVLAGNVAPFFLIRIKLIGDSHGGHDGGSNWMLLMEGDVVGNGEILERGRCFTRKYASPR